MAIYAWEVCNATKPNSLCGEGEKWVVRVALCAFTDSYAVILNRSNTN